MRGTAGTDQRLEIWTGGVLGVRLATRSVSGNAGAGQVREVNSVRGLDLRFRQKPRANTLEIAAVEIKGLDRALSSDLDAKRMLVRLNLDARRSSGAWSDQANRNFVYKLDRFRQGDEAERVRNDGGMAAAEFPPPQETLFHRGTSHRILFASCRT